MAKKVSDEPAFEESAVPDAAQEGKEKGDTPEIAPAQAVASAGAEPLLYVGPTLRKPVHLQHRSVYSGGVPWFARALAARDAELAACFLPLAEAGKALRELEAYPGTIPGAVSRHYNSVRQRYLEVK
jgi:hypothetical protein